MCEAINSPSYILGLLGADGDLISNAFIQETLRKVPGSMDFPKLFLSPTSFREELSPSVKSCFDEYTHQENLEKSQNKQITAETLQLYRNTIYKDASNDDTSSLFRNACDSCSKGKTKCDGQRPNCTRCMSKHLPCVYSMKKKGKSTQKKANPVSKELLNNPVLKDSVLKDPVLNDPIVKDSIVNESVLVQSNTVVKSVKNDPNLNMWWKQVQAHHKEMLENGITWTGCDVVSDIQVFSQKNLPKDIACVIFELTKSNMEQYYNSSAYGWEKWDDEKKRKELLMNDEMVFWVFYDSAQEIIGFIAYQYMMENNEWSILYIHELQLVEKFRGKRIGKFIMEHIESNAKKLGTKFLMLTVLHCNSTAVSFYENSGFSVDEACPSVCYQNPGIAYRILSKKITSTESKLICSRCIQSFRYKDSLSMHNCVYHQTVWPFDCSLCDKGAICEDQLEAHYNSVHNAAKRRRISSRHISNFEDYFLVDEKPDDDLVVDFKIRLRKKQGTI